MTLQIIYSIIEINIPIYFGKIKNSKDYNYNYIEKQII